jgi:large conductance mechanosensitive channel
MKIIKEFKQFISKGNIVELAVAVIIGAAFGNIISSLVDDIVTPLLLSPALSAAGVSEIEKLTFGMVKYGNFLAAIIKFITIAIVLFVIVKMMTRFQKRAEINNMEPSSTDQLLKEIRDELRSNRG